MERSGHGYTRKVSGENVFALEQSIDTLNQKARYGLNQKALYGLRESQRKEKKRKWERKLLSIFWLGRNMEGNKNWGK